MKNSKIFVVLSVCYILTACTSSPTIKNDTLPEETTPIVSDNNLPDINKLGDIEQAYLRNQDVNARNAALLRLANDYRNQQNCNAVNSIIKYLQGGIALTQQRAIANLLKAECVLTSIVTMSELSNKTPLLDLVDKWLNNANDEGIASSTFILENAVDVATRAKVARAELFAQRNAYSNALQVLLTADLVTKYANQPVQLGQYYNQLWEWYSSATKQQRQTLAQSFPLLRDYKILVDTVEDTGISDTERQASIKQWLLVSSNSSLVENLPTQVQRYLAISQPETQNIAVLLPLSGRLAGQGEAIKQGMLSAYYHKLEKAKENNTQIKATIEFIDTGSLPTMSSAITTEQLAPFDTIVGPLLRTHIEQLSQFNFLGKHQLLLNQAPTMPANEQNLLASFSLSPEQEAEQLVALMRARNITNPVLIDDGTSTTRRMTDAFLGAWEVTELSNRGKAKVLQQVRYSDNKSMRVGITSALDVLQSQNRIAQLSNLSQERVISVTRNRRDIDAFVVFARPNDVELINPIIESSISLFTDEQIPVFATSYSYDHKQSKNSQRDLRNLVFVDMPWLLPEGRGSALSSSVDRLFNEPPSAFLRLFAFGYDAIMLVDNLAQLSTFAHLSVSGLSGNLSINDTQQLTRELAWISIDNN